MSTTFRKLINVSLAVLFAAQVSLIVCLIPSLPLRPPKDRPWYHLLVDGASHTTYVAERHLEPADPPHPIEHALVDQLFAGFDGARYTPRRTVN